MKTQRLTEREEEVLRLVVDQKTRTQIAEALNISPRTVDTHRQHIGQKIGTTHLMGYIRYALHHKLVQEL